MTVVDRNSILHIVKYACTEGYKSRAPPALATQAGGRARSQGRAWRVTVQRRQPGRGRCLARVGRPRRQEGDLVRVERAERRAAGARRQRAAVLQQAAHLRRAAPDLPLLPLLQVFAWLPATGRRTDPARRSASAGSARAQARSSTASFQ